MDAQIFNKLVLGLFGAGVSLLGFLAVQLWSINAKLAVLMNTVGYHERGLKALHATSQQLEKRLYVLESKRQ